MTPGNLVFVICLHLFISLVSTSFDKKLKYYEILDEIHIHSREARSPGVLPNAPHCKKNIRLSAMGRNFSVHLTKSREELFSKNFQMKIVHEDGTWDKGSLDVNNFCSGVLEGDDKSEVIAYFDGDGSLASAKISTLQDDFLIEPAWRHSNRKQDERKMLIYKGRDIKWPYNKQGNTHPNFCGAFHPDKEHGFDDIIIDDIYHNHHNHYHKEHNRQKREVGSNKICKIIAVADYKFYSSMGGSQIYRTASYIVNVIDQANKIYKTTEFFPGVKGYGLEIDELRIHDGYTATSSGSLHYNMAKTDWQIQQLLDTFSTDVATFKKYCLAHLFTHEAFVNNIMGLAYIAGTKLTDAGGICSPITTKNGRQYSLNTGWTTTMDEDRNTVLARQSELVTAHEFGHNWGSEHDPTSGTCAPGSILDNGKYLMYHYAVSGEDGNNNKFSSCSIRYIQQVLNAKAQSCFSVAEEESLCGNGRIDSGEQCDGGYLGKYKLDPCCNSDCTLAAGAICSPVNYPCCSTSCQIATGLVCEGGTPLSCKNTSLCTGTELTCPVAPNKPTGTPCIEDGSCRDGVCIAFCEFIGRTSCACDNVADTCKRCCRDPNDSNKCKPYSSTLILSDGRACIQGYCKSGVCSKKESSLVERFWTLIDKLSFDYVAETFKTNMVAFIQVFSLFLWFPIGCCVWCKDKRSKKKIRRDNDICIRENRSLIYDEDGRKVKRRTKTLRPGFGRNALGLSRPMNLRPITEPLALYHNRPSSAASRTSGSRNRNRVVPLPKKVAAEGVKSDVDGGGDVTVS